MVQDTGAALIRVGVGYALAELLRKRCGGACKHWLTSPIEGQLAEVQIPGTSWAGCGGPSVHRLSRLPRWAP